MATILIVDDEKPVRQLLAGMFENAGHRVLQAWHGQHALDLVACESNCPDLVVSDVMMPLVGGVELCRILKASPATSRILIVLMSAAHAKASTCAGADAIVGKPFELDVLNAIVERLLSARSNVAETG